MAKKREERGKLSRHSHRKGQPTRRPRMVPYYLRDTAPQWIEMIGEAVLNMTPRLRIPVRFGMASTGWVMPAFIKVEADHGVLEPYFDSAFEGQMVRFELGDLDFPTRVKGRLRGRRALLLEAAPFFRAMVQLLAYACPPFLSTKPPPAQQIKTAHRVTVRDR